MKKIIMVVAAALAMTLVSCATTMPLTATSNPLGSKIGEASVSYLLGIIPLGASDLSIYTAAKNGGITKISTVDRRVTPLLFLTTFSTVVSGE